MMLMGMKRSTDEDINPKARQLIAMDLIEKNGYDHPRMHLQVKSLLKSIRPASVISAAPAGILCNGKEDDSQ